MVERNWFWKSGGNRTVNHGNWFTICAHRFYPPLFFSKWTRLQWRDDHIHAVSSDFMERIAATQEKSKEHYQVIALKILLYKCDKFHILTWWFILLFISFTWFDWVLLHAWVESGQDFAVIKNDQVSFKCFQPSLNEDKIKTNQCTFIVKPGLVPGTDGAESTMSTVQNSLQF